MSDEIRVSKVSVNGGVPLIIGAGGGGSGGSGGSGIVSIGFDGAFPMTRPDLSQSSMFIQWKGTDVCLDFICGACHRSTHFDGMFAYALQCPCGAVWEMGTQVIVRRNDSYEGSTGMLEET